ncbi:methyltransferase domain-containing protein [Nocardia sp. alder85J]|uniref:methyltransferase domain-containing protein n=1 Tax=Nocardia sp. alder85J TaxID=2862949 RepID=UPI001CD3D74B|nr:methyltransferase domain-containing protein [Nocardia sp. alder85J]MCX4093206.1 methyltransferase domain-containing protein [Nocardia sp. alder85J]
MTVRFDPAPARGCRACAATTLDRVLDLGEMFAADSFPPLTMPVTADSRHALAMDLCRDCGLAQLADDDTVVAEPRAVEPQALRDQAAAAVAAAAGVLTGHTVREFGSPHGGTWIPLLTARGFTETATEPADVVIDSFGMMHEPDQRAAAAARAAALRPGGVLLLQFHALPVIVAQGQWNALRHGHFAYYSLTALTALLRGAGLHPRTAWEFDLYGGTVLVAAGHEPATPDATLRRLRAADTGSVDPAVVAALQTAADRQVGELRAWLESEAAQGNRVFAYGAASRAVALFARAGLHRGLLAAVADASPAKHGRRMPGTDIPIIAPAELVAARPDRVLLTLPDLFAEVRAALPELRDAWVPEVPRLAGSRSSYAGGPSPSHRGRNRMRHNEFGVSPDEGSGEQ